jgi:cytochrome c peroxidase
VKTHLLFTGLFAGIGLALTIQPSQEPSLMEVPAHFPAVPEHIKAQVTEHGAELGRFLFYDSILSLEGNLACASCHRQEYAFSEGPVNVSALTKNAPLPRNTPALFNMAWGTSFFWDARAGTLQEQVLEVVRSDHEMQLDWKLAEKRLRKSPFYRRLFAAAYGDRTIDSSLIADAITQFELTLLSTDSKYDRVLRGETYFSEDEYKGFVLMNEQTKGDCMHCHVTDGGVLGTTGGISNNGLDDAAALLKAIDQGRFQATKNDKDRGAYKIPSLRNLLYTAPYMHDGRFATLEEVVAFYSS